jgi:hypothetical protein
MITITPQTCKRVIFIGIDGIGLIFKKANTPNLDNFFSSGASSLKVKAVFPSDSAQNWGSMLTGVLPEKHNLKHENLEAGAPYSEDSYYPSIFRLLAKKYPDIKMASFASWVPINTGMIELSVPVDRYSPLAHENFFCRKWLSFKHYFLKDSIYDYKLVSRLVGYIKNPENKDTKFLFIHLTDCDEHGHDHGYDSPNYLKQIEVMDSQVATILAAIEEAGWSNDTLIIMTTDHGGIGKGHGGDSPEEIGVFLSIKGPGIEPNSKIKGNLYNMDCAAIILQALGAEIPENFDAKSPSETPSSNFIVCSGGQTGVDRAALDAALDYNNKVEESLRIGIAGWCPKGREAEDGKIEYKYKII